MQKKMAIQRNLPPGQFNSFTDSWSGFDKSKYGSVIQRRLENSLGSESQVHLPAGLVGWMGAFGAGAMAVVGVFLGVYHIRRTLLSKTLSEASSNETHSITAIEVQEV